MRSVTTNLPENSYQVKSPSRIEPAAHTLERENPTLRSGFEVPCTGTEAEDRRKRKQPGLTAADSRAQGQGQSPERGFSGFPGASEPEFRIEAAAHTLERENPTLSGSSPLVNSHISQQGVENVEIWKRSARIVRPFRGYIKARGVRGKIDGFSKASKRRLKFTAGNADPSLISQFGMTYHESRPSGRDVKRHLNWFLVKLRRAYPQIGYLWVLEFQKRKVPHIHLFLTEGVSYGLHQFMAGIWNDIAEPSSEKHLWWHLRDGRKDSKENNFIPWKMGAGGYLCKYLDKEHQKRVPVGFLEVGRFWGCSRGLVPEPEIVTPEEIDRRCSREQVDYDTGEVADIRGFASVLRAICKAEEKRLRRIRSPWRTKARRGKTSYTLASGGMNFRKMTDYLERQAPF